MGRATVEFSNWISTKNYYAEMKRRSEEIAFKNQRKKVWEVLFERNAAGSQLAACALKLCYYHLLLLYSIYWIKAGRKRHNPFFIGIGDRLTVCLSNGFHTDKRISTNGFHKGLDGFHKGLVGLQQGLDNKRGFS